MQTSKFLAVVFTAKCASGAHIRMHMQAKPLLDIQTVTYLARVVLAQGTYHSRD
jgi:hypothetical protein